MANKRRLWQGKLWPPAVAVALLLGLWQSAVSFGWAHHWTVPAPLEVVQEALRIWPRLMLHTGATLKLALLGFGGGAAAGFTLAALLHLVPVARRGLYPLLILSQNVPIVVLAPIMTMLFGYGLLPKTLLVIMVCFFPIVVAMLGGLAGGEESLRRYMSMIGASRSQLFWKLELPGAISHLFSGLKIAASYSVMSAVFAEMLAPKEGLGGFMVISARGYMPERSFASALLIISISLMLFGLVVLAEKAIIRWRPKREGNS